MIGRHIAGKANTIADARARFRMREFRRLAPSAKAISDVAKLPPSVD